uniref:Uncharacterized protein n=1 Tax=Arundo donax TaxID=35708 RepID=A0A0A9AS94_ARUDO
MMGSCTRTSLCAYETVPSFFSRTITLPATARSRSNHVYHKPPPYVWTPTSR